MSLRASPAKACPRMTVNTPTIPRPAATMAPMSRAVWTGWSGRSRARSRSTPTGVDGASGVRAGRRALRCRRCGCRDRGRAGHDEDAAVHLEHGHRVAVELAQDLGPDDLVGRSRWPRGRWPRRRPGPSPAAAGSCRGRRGARRCLCSRAIRAEECDHLLLTADVQVGEGLVEESSRGRLIRAWAMSTRCCSPPDRLPTRASAKPRHPPRPASRRPPGGAGPRRQGHPEAVAVEPEGHQVPGPQRDVRVDGTFWGT